MTKKINGEVKAILEDWLKFFEDVMPSDAAGMDWLEYLRKRTEAISINGEVLGLDVVDIINVLRKFEEYHECEESLFYFIDSSQFYLLA